jgi:hypothetical protein
MADAIVVVVLRDRSGRRPLLSTIGVGALSAIPRANKDIPDGRLEAVICCEPLNTSRFDEYGVAQCTPGDQNQNAKE